MKPPSFTEADKHALEYELRRQKHTRNVELSRLAEVLELELSEAMSLMLEDAGWHRWVTRAIDRWKDVAATNEILFLREAEMHSDADKALKDVLRWARMTNALPEELARRIEAHLGGSAPVPLANDSDK